MGGLWTEKKDQPTRRKKPGFEQEAEVNIVGRRRVGEDTIANLVRLKPLADRGLHRTIGGMPEHDELTERQVSEPSAEVVVIDEKLRVRKDRLSQDRFRLHRSLG
jgi:hypothetical protein